MIKWTKPILLISVFSVFLQLFSLSSANAIQLTDGTTRRATNSSYLKMTDGGTRQTFTASYGLADTDFQNLPANYYVDNIRLNLSSYLPANTIFTFTVHYRVKGSSTYTAGIEYFGWSSGSSWTLLDDSCINPESSLVTNTSTWETTLTCTYTGFTNVRLDYIDNVDRTRLIRFLNPDSNQGWVNSNGQITIGYIDSRTINWNGLTQDDRDWLESILPDGTTISDVQTGVENALETQSESEREELEDAQNDAEDTADDAGEDAENATQSLREGISSIINLVRDTPASDCNIRINYRIDTGVMNMCQMPDQFKTIIQAVTTIVGTLAILNISYELLLLYVDHIRSFQDGGKEER